MVIDLFTLNTLSEGVDGETRAVLVMMPDEVQATIPALTRVEDVYVEQKRV